ncbi:hypothetical protein L9F63_012352 [Diploptera punctata]|uniref:Uncharacterized protein n=1 Tax=Diploptera punctata TaxID=6984 RepID=A0AAD8ADE4_DIPPU|nr:hypothetical protein L9F63_012352 [Diploptera punctata]
MIVNRFAEEFEDVDESSRLGVRSAGGSRRSKNSQTDSPRDFLANRVSFYMDDVVDDLQGSAPELRVPKRPQHARSKSFRTAERKPVRLTRHTSDVSHVAGRLQRKRPGSAESRTASCRSAGSNNSRLKRQESNSTKRSSCRRKSSVQSSVKLSFKELPPKERRRRVVVLLVGCTFLFLVACSVLAVVITLTHSSFHGKAHYLPDNYPRNNITEYGKHS